MGYSITATNNQGAQVGIYCDTINKIIAWAKSWDDPKNLYFEVISVADNTGEEAFIASKEINKSLKGFIKELQDIK